MKSLFYIIENFLGIHLFFRKSLTPQSNPINTSDILVKTAKDRIQLNRRNIYEKYWQNWKSWQNRAVWSNESHVLSQLNVVFIYVIWIFIILHTFSIFYVPLREKINWNFWRELYMDYGNFTVQFGLHKMNTECMIAHWMKSF